MLLLVREASLLLGCVSRASRHGSLQLTNLRHISLRPASHAVARRPSSPTHLGIYASQARDEAWKQQQQRRRSSTSSSTAAAPAAAPAAAQNSALVTNTTSLLRNVHNGAEVFLVGTAHVSRLSADEVRDVIRAVRPDTVMVELDAARAERLREGNTQADFLKDLVGSVGAPGFDMRSLLVKAGLGGMYQVLKLFGMEPGLEFKVAMQEAETLGARVLYGDQDVSRTLRRLSSGLDWQTVSRLMTSSPEGGGLGPSNSSDGGSSSGGGLSGMEGAVEALKTRAAARRMTQHLRGVAPELAAALVDERDEHMTGVLLQQRGRVVAVVGLAHLDGIERRWDAAQASAGGRASPVAAQIL